MHRSRELHGFKIRTNRQTSSSMRDQVKELQDSLIYSVFDLPGVETDKPAQGLHNEDLVGGQGTQVTHINLLPNYLDISMSQRIQPLYF